MGNFCVDVKYIEEPSKFIFSVIELKLGCSLCFWLVKIVIGSPILPVDDQLFPTEVIPLGTVLPNLRLLPNLPSII
jgi:hypothetical protein